ncbi:MAG: ATP-binding protein [Oscillospiraceae bacterium]|nr:ATP-binding protein [Oscillospiraceae bacterium]
MDIKYPLTKKKAAEWADKLDINKRHGADTYKVDTHNIETHGEQLREAYGGQISEAHGEQISEAHGEQLREAHERTRLLLDAMPLACHLWNKDFIMFDCNEENNRLFDISDKYEIKNSFYKFSPLYQPDGQLSSEKAAESLIKAFEEGRLVMNWMHQTLDGTPIPTEVTLVRVPFGGEYVVAGYARDMREQEKMMDDIRRSETKLEAANNAKSDFLAHMSHEMRTPLSAVIGLSGLILETDGLGEEATSNLEKIYNAGSTLLNIVNDILDISKIEAGKFELIEGEYDIPSLINDTITQNILRIGEKPIEFVLDVSADMPTRLIGDELRIKQIFNNILSNAFKYTQKGTVEFGIRSECVIRGEHSVRGDRKIRSEQGGGNGSGNGRNDNVGSDNGGGNGGGDGGDDAVWVTAWVKDTGKGIQPEDIEKLFLDYTQMDAKANHNIEGTGLGLAITKKMLEAMGGYIEVESEYGIGSIFTVRFRQKHVTNAKIGKAVVNNLKNFRYADNRRKKESQFSYVKLPYAKVLVVDDIPTNLDVAKGLMKQYEMQIDCVSSGQEAIDAVLAEKVRYDVIFMDHMMPNMDGMEAMRHIREIGTDYAKNVPIVALTANAITGNEEMFLNEGFQAFLSKPIGLKQLDIIVKRWARDKAKEKQWAAMAATAADAANAAMAVNTAMTAAATTTSAAAITAKATVAAKATTADMLPKVPGLDTAIGLALYSGDAETYLSVLRSYAENMPVVADKLRSVSSGGLSDYAINVHGLKGASAGIGAESVRALAAALEASAKTGDLHGVQKKNPALLRETDALTRNLNDWFTTKRGAQKVKTPKQRTAETIILTELSNALENYDITNIENFYELLNYVYDGADDDLMHWLEVKITESEFDAATRRIAVILDDLKTTS